jgi:putative endonuclease
MNKRQTGTLGEKLACDFLYRNGYEIIETNFRCPEGEIDIVARQGDTLVFVEVRTKTSRGYGRPEESITPTKMARLRTAAARYEAAHFNLPESRRIDVIAIEMDTGGMVSRIELIENAVEGG